MIGLEIVLIPFGPKLILAGIVAIPVVVITRYISVRILVGTLKKWMSFDARISSIMTWAGLRGGISIAMALSLPQDVSWNYLVTITYIVVIFSIIVQGLTLEKVILRLTRD